MIIAEWIINILVVSFSILCIGTGSVLFVLGIHVFEDWRTNGK
tara:strand:+ start:11156 stop:11284 length:129 start_codon:yes stop_codon:yes gene_type:complete